MDNKAAYAILASANKITLHTGHGPVYHHKRTQVNGG